MAEHRKCFEIRHCTFSHTMATAQHTHTHNSLKSKTCIFLSLLNFRVICLHAPFVCAHTHTEQRVPWSPPHRTPPCIINRFYTVIHVQYACTSTFARSSLLLLLLVLRIQSFARQVHGSRCCRSSQPFSWILYSSSACVRVSFTIFGCAS